jgi:hypothetical protein
MFDPGVIICVCITYMIMHMHDLDMFNNIMHIYARRQKSPGRVHNRTYNVQWLSIGNCTSMKEFI